jgi:hypothetical protein
LIPPGTSVFHLLYLLPSLLLLSARNIF